ncbi:hypothetical protein OUZ56_027738 [Daphnia magna]|uniref:Helicase n=1 Tax=Daphnia magna TaxID=35525 RepID=A0ABR0B1T0_9CRUS|nr:hypothetical protein OUZ56_027738 [Daphnia magna]
MQNKTVWKLSIKSACSDGEKRRFLNSFTQEKLKSIGLDWVHLQTHLTDAGFYMRLYRHYIYQYE